MKITEARLSAALAECAAMEQACSTPDTALARELGDALAERGHVRHVVAASTPRIAWYAITPAGRAALSV